MVGFQDRIDNDTLRKIQNIRVATAPVDLRRLANELGVKVVFEPLMSGLRGKVEEKLPKWEAGSDKAPKPYFLITINSNNPKSLQNFTLAHEIAHVVLHQEYIKTSQNIVEHWDATPLFNVNEREVKTIEKEAQKFAAWLLVPFTSLAAFFERYGDVQTPVVADTFGVSQGMMEIRLKDFHRWKRRKIK